MNDNAERGVALVQSYNRLLTKDEEQLQFLLQVVSEHRRVYPDTLKKKLYVNPCRNEQSSICDTPAMSN